MCETLFYYRNSLSHVLRLTHACYYLVIGGHRVPQHEAGGGGRHLLQAAERGGPLQAGQPGHLLQPALRQGAEGGAGPLGAQDQHDRQVQDGDLLRDRQLLQPQVPA